MQNQLIACRFFTTIGHFVALLLLFTIVENNIEVLLFHLFVFTLSWIIEH
jgi:hypothetical protein